MTAASRPEPTFEELLASSYLEFNFDAELLPHLLAFGPAKHARRPWLFEAVTTTTVTTGEEPHRD